MASSFSNGDSCSLSVAISSSRAVIGCVAFLDLGDQRVDAVAAAHHLGHLLGEPGLEVLKPEFELTAQHGIFGAQAVAVGLKRGHGRRSARWVRKLPEPQS